jgi:hypothetical protein
MFRNLPVPAALAGDMTAYPGVQSGRTDPFASAMTGALNTAPDTAPDRLTGTLRGISANVTTPAPGAKPERLGTSSAEIVSVIKIITSIAEQTHLPAPGATIEAARANEPGRNVGEVAAGTRRISTDVGEVAAAAGATTGAAGHTATAADEPARVARDLQDGLAMFRH